MAWSIKKPFKVTIKKPKITVSKERAAMAVFTLGASEAWKGIDNSLNNGNVEKWTQNQWNNVTGKNAREAQEQAGKEAEKVRREGIVREFGARQQADSMAFASAMGGSGGASNNAPGLVGQSAAPGTIGANISSSGTF